MELATLKANIKELEVLKSELKKKASGIKSDFMSYIGNTSIPLAERWCFFIEADDELKNHQDWLLDGRNAGIRYVNENYFDAPEVYGRGKRIDVSDIFSDWTRKGELHPEGFSWRLYEDCPETAEKYMVEAMEYILSRNIGSFCFDW